MAEFSCRPRQVDGDGAAKRRRLRRLRSRLRHEQQTVAAVLATVTHHSSGKVGTTHAALRGQKQGTRTVQGEEYELYYTAKFRTTPLPTGGRPAPLPEVAGWQGRLEQHVLEDLGSMQILDLPVLQGVEQPEEVGPFFRNSVPAFAEQVIEVPKLALPVCAVQRAALPEPQLVEQLVEVPTVLTYSLLQQRTAEQLVDNPAPHGRGRDARGGLQGLSQGQGSSAVSGAVHGSSQGSQGQGSTAVCGAEHVDTRGGGARGGLPGLSQGQGSTAVCGAEHVDTRGGGARGGLPGLSQGQGSTAVCGAEHVSQGHSVCGAEHSCMVVVEVLVEVFKDRVPQRLLLSRPSVFIVVHKVFLVDRVPQRLPLSRLFLRILIDRCHGPRFMAVMTSGCV